MLGCSEKGKKTDANLPNSSAEQPQNDMPRKPLTLKVVRVEQEMFASKTVENIENVLLKHPNFTIDFIKINEYPSRQTVVNSFYNLVSNPSIDSIYHTCQEHYGDFYDIGIGLETSFENIKANFKDFTYPVIYTAITGMGNDMFVNDSMVVIGLEFFLAEKSHYLPHFPTYILKRYRKEYIVPHVLMLISNKYNHTDYIDNSLIAEMIYYGKSYYFVSQVYPALHDSLICGYSASQIADLEKNSNIVWQHFVDKKLLFETKHEIVNKYIGERPSVTEIGSKCPGRIGRWLGWQIVKRYMQKNKDTKLSQLMYMTDARKIFFDSKYKP
ncbi:MAG: gliding motility lipoprotein GldB [Cytophagales bacterium]|nr:gliding motility lipoprotein GldB [Cytophagales bacterium]